MRLESSWAKKKNNKQRNKGQTRQTVIVERNDAKGQSYQHQHDHRGKDLQILPKEYTSPVQHLALQSKYQGTNWYYASLVLHPFGLLVIHWASTNRCTTRSVIS